ncbi:SHOCT domain-containing protein [Microbacter sp. GSS18]|nr:SHOCT domain-containing protein [Microbacter sp. GSS18]
MPLRRMGRPGLVGMAARTAVVAGTATAVSGGVARRQQARAQSQHEQQQYEAAQQQAQIDAAAQAAAAQYAAPAPAPAPAPAAAPAGGTDIVAELQKLGALKDAGVLSDAEFAAAKAKLLG